MKNEINLKEKKIKILHIISSINLYGGTPRKVLWLARESKYTHLIFFSGNKESELNYSSNLQAIIDSNIRFIEPFHKRNLIKQLAFLTKFIKKEKIQVIQCNFNYDYVLGAFVKIMNPKLKFITTFVGAVSPRNKLSNLILEQFLRLSDYHVYISNYVKKSKQVIYKSLSKKKSKIIYNGAFPLTKVQRDRESPKENIVLTTISGLNNYKNLFVLLEAMFILTKNCKKKIILNIIGDGPLKKDLQEKIDSLKLNEIAIIHGYINDINHFLSNTDIYVHPADKEGFGIAVIEAMSVKLPVILSNAGALPELIIDKQSGLLAEPHNPHDWVDKVKYLVNNNAERERLAHNGMVRVKEYFTLSKYVKSYDDLYEDKIINS